MSRVNSDRRRPVKWTIRRVKPSDRVMKVTMGSIDEFEADPGSFYGVVSPWNRNILFFACETRKKAARWVRWNTAKGRQVIGR